MCSSTNHEHTRAGVLRTPTKQRNKGDHAKRSPKRFTQSTRKEKQEKTPKTLYQLKPATLRLQKITRDTRSPHFFPSPEQQHENKGKIEHRKVNLLLLVSSTRT